MYFNEYQEKVTRVKRYSKDKSKAFMFLLLKLQEESGEVSKEMVRVMENNEEPIYDKDKLRSELGDVLWTVAALAQEANISLYEVAEDNVQKLRSRNLL